MSELQKTYSLLQAENSKLQLQVISLTQQNDDLNREIQKLNLRLQNQQATEHQNIALKRDILRLQELLLMPQVRIQTLDHFDDSREDPDKELRKVTQRYENKLQTLLDENNQYRELLAKRSSSQSQQLEMQAAKLIEIGQKLEQKIKYASSGQTTQNTLPSISEQPIMRKTNIKIKPNEGFLNISPSQQALQAPISTDINFDDSELQFELKNSKIKTQQNFKKDGNHFIRKSINISLKPANYKSLQDMNLPKSLQQTLKKY
ncbi:hypothetical protein pb186bvf_010226 [Paramecium bursaria]